MFFILNKSLLLVPFILILFQIITIDTLENKSIVDEICHSLRQSQGKQINILAIGVLNQILLAITNDYRVFQVNLSENVIKSLLTTTKPKSISNIYPYLNSNQNFQIIYDFPINAYLMMENDNKNWIILNTWIEDNVRYGLAFDMHDNVSGQWYFLGNMSGMVPISTEKKRHFYLWKKSKQNPNAFELNEYLHLEDLNYNQIQLMRSSGIVCETNEKLQLTVNKSHCHQPVNWQLITGFVAQNKFFLFDNAFLYIFDENIHEKQTVRLEKLEYCQIPIGNLFISK